MVIPKPFSRPGIDLSSGAKKEWKETSVYYINEGDIIVDYGLVEKKIKISLDEIEFVFSSGTTARFESGKVVKAFVPA